MIGRRRPIIGIAGFGLSGKDTLATRLITRWQFVRVGFADALKAEVRKNFRRTLLAIWQQTEQAYPKEPMTPEAQDRVIDYLIQTKPPIVRELMQEYGTEVRRGDYEDYWTDRWDNERVLRGARIVAPDVRYESEMRRIRAFQGYLLKIVRPENVPINTHASEAMAAKWPDSVFDHVFKNEGTIEDLWIELDGWVAARIQGWA